MCAMQSQEAEMRQHLGAAPAAHSPLLSRLLQYPPASPGASVHSRTASACNEQGFHPLQPPPPPVSRLARGSSAGSRGAGCDAHVGVAGGIGDGAAEGGLSREGRDGAGGLHSVTAAPADSDTDDEDAMEELRAKLTQGTALPGCAPPPPRKSSDVQFQYPPSTG